MTITDGRRVKRDMGPGSGLGHMGAVNLVNVIPDLEIAMTPVTVICAVCPKPASAGKMTCSPPCARVFMGRWSV